MGPSLSNMELRTVRYYVWTGQARNRVPWRHAANDADAAAYARSINAWNVVREDGPMTKPTAVRRHLEATMNATPTWLTPRAIPVTIYVTTRRRSRRYHAEVKGGAFTDASIARLRNRVRRYVLATTGDDVQFSFRR